MDNKNIFYNSIIHDCCEHRNIKLIKPMMEKYFYCFNDGLSGACKGWSYSYSYFNDKKMLITGIENLGSML
jgi:hypothetical protein